MRPSRSGSAVPFGVAAAPAPVDIPAPVFTSDWEAHQNGDQVECNSLSSPVYPGVDRIIVESSTTGLIWNAEGSMLLEGTLSFGSFISGAFVFVRAAFGGPGDTILGPYEAPTEVDFI